ncbi:hypothetical protein WJX72_004419 [[Myrmecia] bisecta]|uniref:Uncharacterized protein n=1 Tax=[Myrmecia] bisecta TaxID=41462 RepID=A0AAW1P8D7_9CHLO
MTWNTKRQTPRKAGASNLPHLPSDLFSRPSYLGRQTQSANSKQSSPQPKPALEGDDDFAEPGTPRRIEGESPGKGGGSHIEAEGSYEWLYEDANRMLKNLHFARLKRVHIDGALADESTDAGEEAQAT